MPSNVLDPGNDLAMTKAYASCYVPFLECLLTPERLEHSLGVMRVMGELADVYGLDRTKAMTAGLLHDAARDLEAAELMALAEEGRVELRYACERHPLYLHAPVSAYLVSTDLELADRLILDAISAHSFYGSGDDLHLPLRWCLRFADLLAPVKDWQGMKRLGATAYGGQMEEAALLQCHWLIEYLQDLRVPVHPNLVKTRELLLAKLRVDEAFFKRW